MAGGDDLATKIPTMDTRWKSDLFCYSDFFPVTILVLTPAARCFNVAFVSAKNSGVGVRKTDCP